MNQKDGYNDFKSKKKHFGLQGFYKKNSALSGLKIRNENYYDTRLGTLSYVSTISTI